MNLLNVIVGIVDFRNLGDMKITAYFENQIILGVSWGTAVIPRRAYFCLELPFVTVQVYLWEIKRQT